MSYKPQYYLTYAKAQKGKWESPNLSFVQPADVFRFLFISNMHHGPIEFTVGAAIGSHVVTMKGKLG